MTYEHKPGSGSAIRNKHRSKDTHPHFKGDVMTPDGKLWDIAIWESKTQGGSDRLSIKVSDPRDRRERAPEPQSRMRYGEHRERAMDPDDSIPF